MGLDNIPKTYPCKDKATMRDGQIDCVATQECGNCTWKNKYADDPLVNNTNPTYGMFGTDCWYRGKYGNYLLDLLKSKSDDFTSEMPFDFYGDGSDDENEGISEEACLDMSAVMANYTELWGKEVENMVKENEIKEEEKDGYVRDWIYATWWLRFVAKTSNGSAVWY